MFAAFILAPVFFLSLRAFLGAFHWRSGLLFFLTGSSLALTHPIILAYSVFIAGVYALIETILVRDLKRLTLAIVVLGLITIPSASLSFIDEAWVDHNVLGLEPGLTMPDNFSLGTARESSSSVETLISHVEGTPFYGFDLEKVQILAKRIPGNPVEVFLSWSYLWILGLGFLWSLFNLKRDATAPFIAATSFLVFNLCAIPYTGWLVGYFVSARMLWRVPWLLPIGLISFVILRELFNAIGNKVSTSARLKENINRASARSRIRCTASKHCITRQAQWPDALADENAGNVELRRFDPVQRDASAVTGVDFVALDLDACARAMRSAGVPFSQQREYLQVSADDAAGTVLRFREAAPAAPSARPPAVDSTGPSD